MQRAILFSLLFLLLLSGPSAVSAQLEAGKALDVRLDESPVDIATSPDGKITLILTESGKVYIIDNRGTLIKSFSAGIGFDSIEYQASVGRIVLSSSRSKTIRFIPLETVHSIDIKGSPFKGSEGAPVTIVTYDDFQ